jgi:hypothetical protein
MMKHVEGALRNVEDQATERLQIVPKHLSAASDEILLSNLENLANLKKSKKQETHEQSTRLTKRLLGKSISSLSL